MIIQFLGTIVTDIWGIAFGFTPADSGGRFRFLTTETGCRNEQC